MVALVPNNLSLKCHRPPQTILSRIDATSELISAQLLKYREYTCKFFSRHDHHHQHILSARSRIGCCLSKGESFNNCGCCCSPTSQSPSQRSKTLLSNTQKILCPSLEVCPLSKYFLIGYLSLLYYFFFPIIFIIFWEIFL